LVERNHDLHPVSDETIFAENDHVFVFSDYEALNIIAGENKSKI
jgi:hypothetical protein